jgi:outer membrane protein insertion porin family
MLFLHNLFSHAVIPSNFVVRWLSLAAILFICFLPTSLAAQKKISIFILPFEIYSIEDLTYLEADITKAIKIQLEQEGARVLVPTMEPDALWRQEAKSLEGIRRLGLQSGADYIIWGSLTRLGQQFSLDAKMVELFGRKKQFVFSIEGQGLENLPLRVNELSREMGLKLFKREKIAKIQIEGNERIEADAINRVIKTAPGDIYRVKNLSDDLKAIYAMGYFEDVRIEAEDQPEGKVIIFKVKEKKTIRAINTKGGSDVFKEDEVLEVLTIKPGSILNIYLIQNNILRIENLYKEKNYHNVKIDYKIIERDNNSVDLEFHIKEGEKVRIKHIIFEGNSAFSDKELNKEMKTSKKGFLAWFTGSGELKREDLNEDIAKLAAFYHNQGYIRAKVGEPLVEIKADWIDITIKISEGPKFKVGKVDVAGDLLLPREKFLEKLKIQKEEFYNREILRKDIITLSDFYADEGYAFADIAPRIKEDVEQLVVDITFVVRKGNQVYFEEILITGNTKTRDKVIRRQLNVYEQELFSSTRLKSSIQNLHRLDFFKDIQVDTSKGSSDDKMKLKIDVEEKPTGSFTFGGGYSNIEKIFIMASVSQKNLFGRAQILDLRVELGDETDRYSINFVEPWLFDIPLSAGFRIYNWKSTFDTYNKDAFGASISVGYRIFNFTRLRFVFAHDSSQLLITDPDGVPISIRDLVATFGEGEDIITNSVTGILTYDSRNLMFSTTDGSNHKLTVEYAGFGGDIKFIKSTGQLAWFRPLFWKFVGFVRAKAGYGSEGEDGAWPDYDRFFLGGINSLRGYEREELSPLDENGNLIGGDKFVQFNFELIFPLIKDVGLDGLIFYDTGDVYTEDQDVELDSLRESVGFEFRWNSPMGPLRVAYGYKLDPQPGEKKSRWEFSMGVAF